MCFCALLVYNCNVLSCFTNFDFLSQRNVRSDYNNVVDKPVQICHMVWPTVSDGFY